MTRFIAPAATTLTTVTFTSSQNWTAPSGVAMLIVLQGKGQDGADDSYATETFSLISGGGSSYVGGPRARSTDLNFALGQAGNFSGSGNRTVNYSVRGVSVSDPNNVYISTISASASVTGSPTISSGSGSGNWSGGLDDNATYVDVSILVNQNDGYVGNDTTAFGQTFSGGFYGSAAPHTYNNVAVTPGQSYSINVASGGFVTIQYYS